MNRLIRRRVYRKADLNFDQMVANMKNYVLRASGCSSPREMINGLAKAVIEDHSECLGDVEALMDELVDDVAGLIRCIGRAAVSNVSYLANILDSKEDANDYLERVETQAIAELTQNTNMVDAVKMFEDTERIASRKPRLRRW